MHRLKPYLSTTVLVIALAPAAATQTPVGPEFQVNTYTTSSQQKAVVAADAAGNFVVVWASNAQDGDSFGIFGQRFDLKGARLGPEFQVNTYTTGFQYTKAVAAAPDGNFVVAWAGPPLGPGLGIDAIFARRYDAAGVPQGPEFQVDSNTVGNHIRPWAAFGAAGGFVVVWTQYGQDGNGDGVFGRRFSAAGTPLAPDFRVNTYTTSTQESPRVAADAAGNFVVVWESFLQDGSGGAVFGQRFDASGVPQGAEFRVNTYTTGSQQRPAVASAANGSFVVVWESPGQDGSATGIFGQRFDPAGVPQGSEFKVNTHTANDQYWPSVTADADGDFVVAWTDLFDDGSSLGVFAQRYDPSGAPVGGEFQVNTHTLVAQDNVALAAAPNGNFVAVWDSANQDGSSYGIFGQRYGDLIFKDGFESGDTSRWSATVTDGDLGVSGAAALATTSFGLQALVNDTSSLYVQDDSPVSEDRYRARFYLAPNGFDPGEGSSHFRLRVFIASEDVTNRRLATIVLKRQGGAYSLMGRVRRDDGTRADTGFIPIGDSPHSVEIMWRRSSGPGSNDGAFKLWIDDSLVSTLSGLDNDMSAVGFARMGALSVKPGASGTLYWDQFESRRVNYIGP
jgi:hypothetical protein